MRKFKMGTLGLLLAMLFVASGVSVSCSRLVAPSDDAITKDIKAKMFSDPLLKNASVDVTTHGHVITLTGQVPDDSAHLAAYQIATGENGVTKVNDQINVPVAPAEPGLDASSRPPAAARPASAPEAEAPPPSSAPQPMTVTVPANAVVSVRTIDRINSRSDRAGEFFRASLDAPIIVEGRVIVPAGADANLKLIYAKSAGHMTGRSELGLELSSISFQGRTYDVVSSEVRRAGTSRGKQTAERVGGGAALGALIGAIAGGGRGAVIGAAVGGGAGTGAQVWTRGQQVRIPSETRLDFTLEQPLDITYVPGRRLQRHWNAERASSY
jgi:BON domain